MSGYKYDVKEEGDKCKSCGESKFYFTTKNNRIACIKCGKTRRFL